MSNRTARRTKHKMKLAPKFAPSPIKGLVLSPQQKQYVCVCGTITISGDSIEKVNADHLASVKASLDGGQ